MVRCLQPKHRVRREKSGTVRRCAPDTTNHRTLERRRGRNYFTMTLIIRSTCRDTLYRADCIHLRVSRPISAQISDRPWNQRCEVLADDAGVRRSLRIVVMDELESLADGRSGQCSADKQRIYMYVSMTQTISADAARRPRSTEGY